MIINKTSNGRNTTIVNSTITNTQHQDTTDPNTVKFNIETYIKSNVNTPSNISQKSSPEFTTHISPSILIIVTFIPSDIHSHLVASVTNDNSRLTQKNILKIEAQLLALKSYVERELSALTPKIDFFSDSIKNVLSIIKNTKTVKLEFLRKILHYCIMK